MLEDIDYQGSSPLCTQNSVIAQIPQRIPIPRPLSKSNGRVIGHFIGTIADQLRQNQDTPTTATALTTATLWGDLQQTVLDDNTFGGPGGDLTRSESKAKQLQAIPSRDYHFTAIWIAIYSNI